MACSWCKYFCSWMVSRHGSTKSELIAVACPCCCRASRWLYHIARNCCLFVCVMSVIFLPVISSLSTSPNAKTSAFSVISASLRYFGAKYLCRKLCYASPLYEYGIQKLYDYGYPKVLVARASPRSSSGRQLPTPKSPT